MAMAITMAMAIARRTKDDDMVVETIRSQHKGKRGLTEKQILKHIMKTYDVDKARAPAEVKHSIKRLSKSGTIVHYQFKYKMPTHPDRKKNLKL